MPPQWASAYVPTHFEDNNVEFIVTDHLGNLGKTDTDLCVSTLQRHPVCTLWRHLVCTLHRHPVCTYTDTLGYLVFVGHTQIIVQCQVSDCQGVDLSSGKCLKYTPYKQSEHLPISIITNYFSTLSWRLCMLLDLTSIRNHSAIHNVWSAFYWYFKKWLAGKLHYMQPLQAQAQLFKLCTAWRKGGIKAASWLTLVPYRCQTLQAQQARSCCRSIQLVARVFFLLTFHYPIPPLNHLNPSNGSVSISYTCLPTPPRTRTSWPFW